MNNSKNMKRIFIYAVILSWCGLATSSDLTLFPTDEEVTYFWDASISSGTNLPTDISSVWSINTTITIQQRNTTTFFKINPGVETDRRELYLPFRAVYDRGDLTSLWTHPDDELWSVNLKRALVSLFQIKLDSLSSSAFAAQESGIFGDCKVEYWVQDEGRYYKVNKAISHASCSKLSLKVWANSPGFVCPKQFQDIVATDSEREITIDRQGNVIASLRATGRILVQPYQAKVEAHYSSLRQNMELSVRKPIVDKIAMPENEVSTELAFQEMNLDPTFGAPPRNTSVTVKEVHDLLEEIANNLSWEVGVKGLDNQTSFMLLDLTWWLTIEDWESLYDTITLGTSYTQETIQNLFWDLVPQAGSRSSALFIRNLVTTNRVRGRLGAKLVVEFPFYLRQLSEDLLVECESFLSLPEDIPKETRHSAILGYSSLLKKICGLHCKTDTLDKYAKVYLDKFTESTTHEYQMLWLQGLSNLELFQALDFFIPIITGETRDHDNRHIRGLAMWATLHTVFINPSKVHDVYWPIFTNTSEPLELRTIALTLLFMSNQDTSRIHQLYWYMRNEKSEQLYNYYYTTIHSLATTTFPCYQHLRRAASTIARFVTARSRHWATGNYILDFEEPDRDYGGLLQTLLMASEYSGLPNIFIFMVNSYSLGRSRQLSLYLKVEGLDIYKELYKIMEKIENGNMKISKMIDILKMLKVPVKIPERIHLELIFKVDGITVLSQFMNQTSFREWTASLKRLSSLFIEFSVNSQSLRFPQVHQWSMATDLGLPATILMRSSVLTSARGSVSQDNGGLARNAELDLRFSWNSITTLEVYNPFNNTWHGAERCRNLHVRLPFATQLNLHFAQSFYNMTAVKHRGFVAGSRLGLVWHASTRLISDDQLPKKYLEISDEWTIDTEDLGARLGASVFDCSHPDTLPDALHLLKGSFMADHKNYHIIPGGVVLLGLLSLADQMHFQPTGSSCGVMLYFSPLANQGEPVLRVQGEKKSLSMNRNGVLLWEIQAGSKQLYDGNKEFVFKLYRAPSVSVSVDQNWRIIQFEGAFIVPSRISGVFHPPAALTGYAFVSWGDAAPRNADKAAMLDLKVIPAHNETQVSYCKDYSPECLQAASDLAARQTANLQYANVPTWLKTAAHALFPEHIQTESTRTQVTFAYPVALLPWNTNGLCALNNKSVLTLDNTTFAESLTDCYSLAVADCSDEAQFGIFVKRIGQFVSAKMYCGNDDIELFPNGTNFTIRHQGNEADISKLQNDAPGQLSVRVKRNGVIEAELRSGVVLQHYNTTVILLVPAKFRGYTCGLCGNFNGDINNEPSNGYCPNVILG